MYVSQQTFGHLPRHRDARSHARRRAQGDRLPPPRRRPPGQQDSGHYSIPKI